MIQLYLCWISQLLIFVTWHPELQVLVTELLFQEFLEINQALKIDLQKECKVNYSKRFDSDAVIE